MKTLNAILRKQGLALVALLLVFAATGCDTLNNEEPEVAALTQDDLEAASSILAESLSDQNEGLMSSLNDMTAEISTSEINYDRRSFSHNPGSRPCRGANREFEKTYNDSTGVHTIHYTRNHDGEMCQKDVEVNLTYTFTNGDGNFMATPRADKDQISEIVFAGTRVGSGAVTTRRGSSSRTFAQDGEWTLSGLQTDVASLLGSQVNDGTFAHSRTDSAGAEHTRRGSFHIEFSTVDVTISQTEGEDSDLETQITGTIQYTMSMQKSFDEAEPELVETEGTIELEGNGRALLRFLGLRKIYRVTLADGDVVETSGETGGDG